MSFTIYINEKCFKLKHQNIINKSKLINYYLSINKNSFSLKISKNYFSLDIFKIFLENLYKKEIENINTLKESIDYLKITVIFSCNIDSILNLIIKTLKTILLSRKEKIILKINNCLNKDGFLYPLYGKVPKRYKYNKVYNLLQSFVLKNNTYVSEGFLNKEIPLIAFHKKVLFNETISLEEYEFLKDFVKEDYLKSLIKFEEEEEIPKDLQDLAINQFFLKEDDLSNYYILFKEFF